ncbi:putative F-box protein At3g16210 [Lactuca sativa]|uniref:F-box domain-containing protein n=1 Tax=Lactuca sativa TaxID=4236 RepID=A0A9R1VA51_LACSA|nr:putative F-box protein At3g16210 [Lactuca sativa]KAJ0203242.1 hypothetical protein LSAT_V11C500260660 [Lactuca sativa]
MSDYLCEELIVNILKRLPPKSLLRFRSLCKKLYSYICSPDFIHIHTFQSQQKLLFRHGSSYKNEEPDFYTFHGEDELPLCLERGYIGMTAVEFPFRRDFCIIGSCNGILCVFDYLEAKCISLWNPSIRRKLTLPDCPHRSFSRVHTGFGFDPITNDYKIVSIHNRSSFVYAMKTGTWCAVASPTPLFHEVLSNACFVNGALHWVVEVEPYFSQSNGIVDICYILTFDLSTHVFGTIALLDTSWETRELTTIQGSLAVISYCMDYREDDDESWIWMRRVDSWSLVFKLKTNQVQGRIYRVLQLTNNGDLLFNIFFEGFHVCKPNIETRSRLVDFSAVSCIDDIVVCVESLQLLDMGTACEVKEKQNLVLDGLEFF